MNKLVLKQQEFEFDHPDSKCMFVPRRDKPFVTTQNALEYFGEVLILEKLHELQTLARKHRGLDYLQVFVSQNSGKNLWFIEDGEGGAITALLPEDY